MAREQGFTLFELLATVLIISLSLGGVFVFISNDSPTQQLKGQIDKFISFAEHASDYTMVKGERWGIVFIPPKWREDPFTQGWQIRWQRYTPKYASTSTASGQSARQLVGYDWTDLQEVPPIDVPPIVDMNIEIGGKLWTWEKAPERIEPLIVFYSSGEITPFEIELLLDMDFAEPQHIEVDDWGKVVWRQREEMRKAIEEDFANN